MKYSKIVGYALMGLLVLGMVGCAPHNYNDLGSVAKAVQEHPAGFWLGLWHGLIMPFTFIVSLFSSKVGIYEVHNVGTLYNLGFVLGAIIGIGGAANRVHKNKRK